MASKEITGVIVSDKMDKSVVVAVERRVQHDVYSKIQKRTTTFLAHNENDEAKVGDTVTIAIDGETLQAAIERNGAAVTALRIGGTRYE